MQNKTIRKIKNVLGLGTMSSDSTEVVVAEPVHTKTNEPSNYNYDGYDTFTGEKNAGEVGYPIPTYVDYYALATNGWNQFLDNSITRTIIGKMTTQIIGKGLRLESEVEETVLTIEGVDFTKDQITDLQKRAESLFRLDADSVRSGHGSTESINQLAKTAFRYSLLGDCLVILRTSNGRVTVQLVDGNYIYGQAEGVSKRNTVVNGVETNTAGRIVAFHVSVDGTKHKRVLARDRVTGIERAFLIKSLSYRIGETRGLSQISPSIEQSDKLDRFTEASVKKEEIAAGITFSVEHQEYSTGKNPMSPGARIAEANSKTKIAEDPIALGDKACNKLQKNGHGTAVNLPIGASLKSFKSENQSTFSDFFDPMFNIICGNLQIPPEVARSMYDSNYSASRAAIMDWAETVEVYRSEFSKLYYDKIYKFWFLMQNIKQKPTGGYRLEAPGYIDAFNAGHTYVTDAYEKARWIGKNRPHIDPLKEVNAIRKTLGTKFDSVPLMDLAAAVEKLGGGDFDTTAEKIKQQMVEVGEFIPEETSQE